MGRGIACDVVGEPPLYFKRKNPPIGARPRVRRPWPGLPQTADTLNPDIFRMQFPPSNNRRELKNRGISTIRFQNLKYGQGNCMRHCWGTTPVPQTEEPTGMEVASIRRGHTAPKSCAATPPQAPHNVARPRPVSRPRPRRAHSAALSEAPPIRRSCPRDPRPRRGQPRGGRRGRGTASRTRSPGPRHGRSGSTAGRHRARRTRRA